MVEIRSSQPDTMLSREQLHEVERFQARFAEVESQLHNCVDEFLGVLNRHYFNRENGYLDEQVENLREIATIQSRLESLAANMSAGAGELKARMLEIQRQLQSKPGAAAHSTEHAPVADARPDAAARDKKTGQAKEDQNNSEPAARVKAPAKGRPAQKDALIGGEDETLSDGSQAGGEISLKLVFEGLRLTDPANAEALNQISGALRKLLYERKLIGYSKTSLVFGKNRTVDEVLADLEPIFFSDSIRQLLVGLGLTDPGESGRLRLACSARRELIYISKRDL